MSQEHLPLTTTVKNAFDNAFHWRLVSLSFGGNISWKKKRTLGFLLPIIYCLAGGTACYALGFHGASWSQLFGEAGILLLAFYPTEWLYRTIARHIEVLERTQPAAAELVAKVQEHFGYKAQTRWAWGATLGWSALAYGLIYLIDIKEAQATEILVLAILSLPVHAIFLNITYLLIFGCYVAMRLPENSLKLYAYLPEQSPVIRSLHQILLGTIRYWMGISILFAVLHRLLVPFHTKPYLTAGVTVTFGCTFLLSGLCFALGQRRLHQLVMRQKYKVFDAKYQAFEAEQPVENKLESGDYAHLERLLGGLKQSTISSRLMTDVKTYLQALTPLILFVSAEILSGEALEFFKLLLGAAGS